MSIDKRSRTLEARMYERYPERLHQLIVLDAEGQDLRADGPAPAGVSFLISLFFTLMQN